MPELTLVTSRVGVIGANLSVNLDQTLVNNSSNFTSVESIFQSVAEENVKREGFAELMWARRRTRSLKK